MIEIYEATDAASRDAVFRFRYEVHVHELGKGGPGVDHERRMIIDDADDNATILYAENPHGEIVGTGRTWFGSAGLLPESLRNDFDTGSIEAALGVDKVSATGRLMVDPRYRGRTLASLLVRRLYELAVSNGTAVDYCVTQLPLMGLYQRLGYRAYRSGLRPDGINLRIPMVLCVRDRAHLAEVRSPFLRLLDETLDDCGSTATALQAVYGDFRRVATSPVEDVRTLWAELAEGLTRRHRPRASMLDGFSEDELKKVFGRAIRHRFTKDETIRLGEERCTGLGVILDGRVGVGLPAGDSYHWVELLGPGDPFGESFVAPSEGRVADLVALSDCEIVLLPDDIVERLEQRDAALALRMARNMAAVLRQRVDDLHVAAVERRPTMSVEPPKAA